MGGIDLLLTGFALEAVMEHEQNGGGPCARVE
jgi:hypothetical protein